MTNITPVPAPLPGGWFVVASRFHGTVVDRLVDGALACLEARGLAPGSVTVLRVAGAFELPQAAAAVARRQPPPAGVIALGAVVRGDTPHFDHVCREASQGLMTVALQSGIPMGFGLLTCDTMAQALARAGGEAGNKGWEAAEAAWDLRATLDCLGAPEAGPPQLAGRRP